MDAGYSKEIRGQSHKQPDPPPPRRLVESRGTAQAGREWLDATAESGQIAGMRPVDIQAIGQELAIKWDDGSESFVSLEALRRACPCAGCQGERDVMGNLHKPPPQPLSPRSFQLVRLERVGGYAIQPVWADGHNTGLYPFDYLRRLPPTTGT